MGSVPAPAGWVPMEDLARRVGAWAWAEDQLYGVLGQWASSPGAPALKVYFDSASQHHAWRARVLAERLPGRLVQAHAGGGPGAVTGPWSPGHGDAMGVLGALDGDGARLAVYCRVVLARAIVMYRRWQDRLSPASERPLARALSMVADDAILDWQEGSALLVEVMDGWGGAAGAQLEEASAAEARFESLLLGTPARGTPAGGTPAGGTGGAADG